MGEFSCAACGAKNPHSTVQCERYQATICEKHCSSCEYFSGFDLSIVHCYYRDRKLEKQRQAKLLEMQKNEEKA